jgi:enoyl-[acyl-carrier-protein] reductase (NADH)
MKGHQILSSILAITPLHGRAVYTSAPSSIESQCESIAVEVAPLRIRVNCLAASSVNNLTNAPDDVVGTALFLASSLSESMTGSRLMINDGLLLTR